MRNATDLKARMVEAASELFRTHGYTHTTNKQIAEALGCTTAALYYYFPNGKRELLHAAACMQSQLARDVLAQVTEARSLDALLVQLGQVISAGLARVSEQSSWLYLEMDALEPDEQQAVQKQFMLIHTSLAELLSRWLQPRAAADLYAWLILSLTAGYQALFQRMGLQRLAPQLDHAALFDLLIRCIGQTEGQASRAAAIATHS